MQASQPYCDVALLHESRATVVSVAGEVDLFAAAALSDALERALRDEDPVVVDLADCTLFDSSGLNALLTASLDATGRGRRILVARTPSSCAERMLSIAAPGRFPAHHSRSDALAALAA
jgi:anti-anti-sigma factor